MARCARDDDDQARSHPPLGPPSLSLSKPSFLALPDIAHSSIAAFLPDGNKGSNSRLRVSEASLALRDTYGGSLTRMSVSHVENSSAARLAALLRRNTKLAEVIVEEHEALPAMCLAIVQGCCRRVENLNLNGRYTNMTQECRSLLAGVLELDGVLAGLRNFVVNCNFTHGQLSSLTKALAGGTSPFLTHFCFFGTDLDENDFNCFADMLEVRARIPGCMRLECFEAEGWFDHVSVATRIRLLRILLPSVTEFPFFDLLSAFGASFCEVRAPYLTVLKISLKGEEDDGAFSSRGSIQSSSV